MSENQEELREEAAKLDQQIHELEKQKMGITKKVITEKKDKKESKGKLKKEDKKPILVQIPSIMTKSFEIIGKHLCSLPPDVSVIEFRGNHKVGNTDIMPIDESYSITFSSADSKELNIEYVQKRNIKTTKIENPFNLNIYNKIMKYISQYLGEFEDHDKKKHTQDLSIEYLVLRVINKEIQSMAGTETDDFMLFFNTTKYENKRFKEQLIKAHIHINKEYIFESGFKHTSLNLVQLIESEKYHENKKDKKRSIIYWEGYHKQSSSYYLAPIANNDIALYIRYNSGYFPVDFVKLKRFYITKANIIKMIDGGI